MDYVYVIVSSQNLYGSKWWDLDLPAAPAAPPRNVLTKGPNSFPTPGTSTVNIYAMADAQTRHHATTSQTPAIGNQTLTKCATIDAFFISRSGLEARN